MGPSRAGVGMLHSTSTSGIFFQGDVQSQALGGGGPRLQRCASANNESYMRMPASPLSCTSNNISISGSSVIDGPSGMQPGSNQDLHSQQVGPRQGASTSMPLPPTRVGQFSLPNGSRIPGSFIQDNNNNNNESVSHLQKKPRLDIKQEDIMQQQVLQQLLQRQDSMQLQSPNPQLQSLIQQQRLRQQQQQQQQLLQSLPPVQRAHLLQQQQQQQLQLRQQLQQQSLQPANAVKRPYDGGVCSRRLMQYLYHQRQRPSDNSISYWRKFVAEYYSPRAKKRWCLSLYDNVGHHSLGVFPQAAMDAWQCDICGSKSGRGFEATFEVLPRLNEIKFGSGVIDELLFLDLPREYRFPSGIMVLEYGQAVQESIYEQLRVVREGQLKVIFTPDLKILTWEFCARRHEELLPRRLVAPQVNQLLQVAQKCQATIAESGSDGVSQQDLQTNSNMVVTAGRQLARSLELQSLNDLGFSKRYVRCLQISEVVNSMKDLMDFCRDTKAGPIEGLKTFPRQTNSAKSQMQKMQEMEQITNSIPGVPADQNTLNKLVTLHPVLGNQLNNNNNNQMGNRGASLSGSAQAIALSNYQNILMRQSSMNSNSQQEASSSFNNTNPNGYQFQGSPNMAVGSGGLQQRPMFQVQQQQQHQSPSHSGSQAMQQHVIQQMLQDMSNGGGSGGGGGGGGGPKPSFSGQSGASGSMSMGREGLRYGLSSTGTSPRPPAVPTRSNSFKSSAAGGATVNLGGGGGNQKAATSDLPSHLCDDIVQDIASEFTGNGFFDNDELEEGMGFGWKA
ncbi:probable transcriptional regulator SLK2 isoform X2 [Rutidosis leptorrhynchoides]|uniref:probable transcriptional regulator SLK2 isoform X2 n=1 Tax=Rutidosis leptorrhynchoides TaxID=125765 RepID=UPI003A99AF3E